MYRRPILCVDDEPANLDLMRAVLGKDNRLVCANGGEAALAAAAKHRPALILLDVEMPGMDGYQVAGRLKADPATKEIPIIFVTSRNAPCDEEAGFAVGGVDYIGKPFNPRLLVARVRTHVSLVRAAELEVSYRDAIAMLGEAGHYNDSDTGVHIWRMAAFSRSLAQALGWLEGDAALLELAAPMHDTGKIGIPDSILKKPGPLDADEWLVMKTHPVIGHQILSKSKAPLFRLAAEVALYHHERWDGSGYPEGLAGEAIPESARIVAVADVFDALTMKRPYKEAWPMDKVIQTLRELSGSHLDARMVSIFLGIMPEVEEIRARWEQREQEAAEG
ncbi:response regulator [Azoarcus sp. TTM-91]|uniref:response regulator n=1 Tax=Azoarcus sp. TTM-91 TaxID=2691581 RepID=UPI00145D3206|nr:HD domain-containing phosphohydrolase [Azoarcus sp. TTM-91]NMG33829.1 response regulator [Azoarcus sp. TTM-91]